MVAQVNLVTLGHVDHGKTTLVAAISGYLARYGRAKAKTYREIDAAPEEKTMGIAFNIAHVRYETERRPYDQVDCPGHVDNVKYLITGSAPADAAILVVSAADGPMPHTLTETMLASQVKIPNVIVYLNKCDQVDDEDMLMQVEEEIRSLLVKSGYPDHTPIVRGSALSALNGEDNEFGYGIQSIQKMLDILDSYVPDPFPSHAVDAPHRKFKAAVYLQKKEEGGRSTPFTQGYTHKFFYKTTGMTGAIQRLYTGGYIDQGPIETAMPGDFVNMEVVLLNEVAMSVGLKFAVQEGGRSIGIGVITEIIE
jgi:translation elongation factor EF-Tu-like GTPase